MGEKSGRSRLYWSHRVSVRHARIVSAASAEEARVLFFTTGKNMIDTAAPCGPGYNNYKVSAMTLNANLAARRTVCVAHLRG